NSSLVLCAGDSCAGRLMLCSGVLRRTKIIPKFEDLSGELERAVVAILDHRNTGAGVLTDIEVLVFREHDRGRVFQLLLCRRLPIHEQLTRATFTETWPVVL